LHFIIRGAKIKTDGRQRPKIGGGQIGDGED
jgi:hypothetical protein